MKFCILYIMHGNKNLFIVIVIVIVKIPEGQI